MRARVEIQGEFWIVSHEVDAAEARRLLKTATWSYRIGAKGTAFVLPEVPAEDQDACGKTAVCRLIIEG